MIHSSNQTSAGPSAVGAAGVQHLVEFASEHATVVAGESAATQFTFDLQGLQDFAAQLLERSDLAAVAEARRQALQRITVAAARAGWQDGPVAGFVEAALEERQQRPAFVSADARSNPAPSLARGAPLTVESWQDFVERLRYDCRGEGVRRHYTADALFVVERKVFVYGLADDYATHEAIIGPSSESVWHSWADFEASLDEDQRAELDQQAVEAQHQSFSSAAEDWKRDCLEEAGYRFTGWDERWEFVGAHLTWTAAEAFISRKKHDYKDGLRVIAEGQPYAWELEAIKAAMMDGQLVYAPALRRTTEDDVFTLLGHAAVLRLKGGSTEMPDFLFDLAQRLSGDPALSRRCKQIEAEIEPPSSGEPTGAAQAETVS